MASDWSFLSKQVLSVLSEALGEPRGEGRGEDRSESTGVPPIARLLLGRKGALKDNRALGVALAAGAEVAQRLYAKPGMRASLDSLIRNVMTGERETMASPHEAARQADWIAALLRQSGIALCRIGVDGVPGSGKSTLARLLAERLGLQWRSLDHLNLDAPLDLSAERAVFEHHRLLRTQNVDHFDAIVYIDEPVEVSKAKVLQRKRGGYLVDLMDYERMKRVGKLAYAVAGGQERQVPDSDVRVKLRPAEGFRIKENAARALSAQGVEVNSALSQEQLLFLGTEGDARQGFVAYVNASGYGREVLSGLWAALDGVGAGESHEKKGRDKDRQDKGGHKDHRDRDRPKDRQEDKKRRR